MPASHLIQDVHLLQTICGYFPESTHVKRKDIYNCVLYLSHANVEINVSCVHVFSYGVWKVEAKFNSIPQKAFSAEFEVKEYGESLLNFQLNGIFNFQMR